MANNMHTANQHGAEKHNTHSVPSIQLTDPHTHELINISINADSIKSALDLLKETIEDQDEKLNNQSKLIKSIAKTHAK